MSFAPVIHLPGMGPAYGPPTDTELGATAEAMPVCVCGCLLNDHADAPDMPCISCHCDIYREDDSW